MAETHGMSHTRLYKLWKGMRKRCNDPWDSSYRIYGGKGIRVWPAWNDYLTFYNWAIDSGYEDGLSIERIDNNKSYSPMNCKFIPRADQAKNTSRVIRTEVRGKILTLSEIAEKYSLHGSTLRTRYYAGCRDEELIAPVIDSRARSQETKEKLSEGRRGKPRPDIYKKVEKTLVDKITNMLLRGTPILCIYHWTGVSRWLINRIKREVLPTITWL